MLTLVFFELTEIATVAMMAWGIGRALHGAIGKSSRQKRIHGQFIPEWVAGTTIAAGILGLVYFGPVANVPVPPSTGYAMYGILIGWCLGMVHGTIRLFRYQRSMPSQSVGIIRETGNPYEPPVPTEQTE